MRRLALALLLGLAGCRYGYTRIGNDSFLDQDLEWVQGQTTAQEVAEALGPPQRVVSRGGDLIFYYRFVESRHRSIVIRYFGGQWLQGRLETKRDASLVAVFDLHDKLRYVAPSLESSEHPGELPTVSLTLDAETPPPPPLVRIDAGAIAGLDLTTGVRADRGLYGTSLRDLEADQGLEQRSLAPWVELSIGRAVRVGADFTWSRRLGDPTRQTAPVRFDGQDLAGPGDYVEPQVDYLTAASFLEWDVLYGRTYRCGVVGGARYFRFDVALDAVSANPPGRRKADVTAELLSPYVGALAEITPVDVLSLSTDVQFIDWSWEDFRLKKAQYLRFRAGITLRPLSWLALGVGYRYELLRAQGRTGRSRGRRIFGALSSHGLTAQLELSF